MEVLDVVEDVGSCIGHGQISAAIDPLPLEHSEEALGRCIVTTVTDVAQAERDVVILQEPLVLVRRELRPAIRV